MFYASVFLCPMPHGVSYTQFYAAADITLGKSGSFFRSGDPGPQKVNGAVLSVHLLGPAAGAAVTLIVNAL